MHGHIRFSNYVVKWVIKVLTEIKGVEHILMEIKHGILFLLQQVVLNILDSIIFH